MKLSQAARFVRSHQYFVITAHETPDGDAIGSECAMYHALKNMGKTAYVYNADESSHKYDFLTETVEISRLLSEDQLPKHIENYVLLILDTNDLENIGQVKDILIDKVDDYFIIDHHENEGQIENTNLIEADASSTCEILFDLFSELNCPLTTAISEALFVGIVYDTGSFIYPKTTAKTFKIAYELVKNGVNPNFIYSKIYESNSISALVLQSRVLSSLELYFDEQVAVQTMEQETIIECGASYEEADTIINIPLKSERIRVSVFFKENTEGLLRCSLRSKGRVNVAEIAQHYGGGGHKTAAGFKCTSPLDKMKQELLQKLAGYFKG